MVVEMIKTIVYNSQLRFFKVNPRLINLLIPIGKRFPRCEQYVVFPSTGPQGDTVFFLPFSEPPRLRNTLKKYMMHRIQNLQMYMYTLG